MKPAASAGRSLVMSVQVTIVGGGIVGAACARALARGGAAVTVVEGRFPGGGATAAGMGHVVVMDDSPAQLALTARSRRLWSELAAELPPEAEYRRADVVLMAAGRLRCAASWREAKLMTRVGMGPCQGRVCGTATEVLFGWAPADVRPPRFPVPLGDVT